MRRDGLEACLSRWLAAERAGEERTAVRAFEALLVRLPRPVPGTGFTDRVMSQWREMTVPPRLEWAALTLVMLAATTLLVSPAWISTVVSTVDAATAASLFTAMWTAFGELAAMVGRCLSILTELGRASQIVWRSPIGITAVVALSLVILASWQLLYQLLQHGRLVHAQT